MSKVQETINNLKKPQERCLDNTNEDLVNELFDGVEILKFNDTKQLYVDGDIHNIFSRLKPLTKLSVGQMTSSILNDWIIKNKEVITEALTTSNRYLT